MVRPLSATELASLQTAAWMYRADLDQAWDYLAVRGIDHDTAVRFKLGFVADPITGHEAYQGRLAIPSLGPDDQIYGMRFRSIDASEPKYLGLAGAETRLFNLRAVFDAGDTICITEGELDAITLDRCGYQAVGVCGANAWKRHHPRIFAGFARIYILGDGDSPGRDFARQVNDSLRNGVVVRLPDGEDVNSVFTSQGEDAIHGLIESVEEQDDQRDG